LVCPSSTPGGGGSAFDEELHFVIAGRVLKSIQNKYQQGLVSSLDLTQANSNYLNAENNYITSVLTLLQAQTSLDKLYNTL